MERQNPSNNRICFVEPFVGVGCPMVPRPLLTIKVRSTLHGSRAFLNYLAL